MGIEETYFIPRPGESDYNKKLFPPGIYFCIKKGCSGKQHLVAKGKLLPCPKCGGRVFFTQ